MITQKQLTELSLNFGIDKFTVFREYLQLVFLNYLYKEKQAEKIYFKGGTCLHFLYRSPRFSEDLDFSTTLKKKTIKVLLKRVIKNVQKEALGASLVFVYSGKKSLRCKIKYQSREFKYPLSVRLDFSFEKLMIEPVVSKIETKFPISFFSLICHLTKEEILTEKIRAFLIRKKGRDIFDLWYLLQEKTELKEKALQRKLRTVKLGFDKKKFLARIKKYPLRELRLDLARFLPRSFRKIIPELKKETARLLSGVQNLKKTEFINCFHYLLGEKFATWS